MLFAARQNARSREAWLGEFRATPALGWPMVLLVIAASWWTIRRSLPADHPGIMHPRVHREDEVPPPAG